MSTTQSIPLEGTGAYDTITSLADRFKNVPDGVEVEFAYSDVDRDQTSIEFAVEEAIDFWVP